MYNYSDIFYDDLTYNIIKILRKKPSTLEEIVNISNNNNLSYTKEEVFNRLIFILSQSGRATNPLVPEIIRTPVIGGDDIYTLLDYERGKIAKHYRKVEVKNNPSSILHISDFHYGKWDSKEDIERNKIIQENIHNYALKKKVDIAFINGDIFNRIKLPKVEDDYACLIDEDQIIRRAYVYLQDKSKREEVISKLNYLKEIFKYSMPNDNRLKYYSIIGNHDKTINALLICLTNQDLRVLSSINPNFYMFPYKDCSIDVGSNSILFTHEVYIGPLIRESTHASSFGEIKHLEDLGKLSIKRGLNNGIYSIISSGHMHDAQLSTFRSKYAINNPIYLVTPSTSIYNINSVVAYITYYNYNSLGILESIDIEPLKCNENLEIIPCDIIHHSFIKREEEYSKVLSSVRNTSTIYRDNKPYTIYNHCYISKDNGLYYEVIRDNNKYSLKIYISNSLINNSLNLRIPNMSVELSNIYITFNELISTNKLYEPYITFVNNILNSYLSNIIDMTNINIKELLLDSEGNINICVNNVLDIDYKLLYSVLKDYMIMINDMYMNNKETKYRK